VQKYRTPTKRRSVETFEYLKAIDGRKPKHIGKTKLYDGLKVTGNFRGIKISQQNSVW